MLAVCEITSNKYLISLVIETVGVKLNLIFDFQNCNMHYSESSK